MKQPHHVVATLLITFFAASLTACISPMPPLRIEPVSNKKSVIEPKFDTAYYYYDRDHNLYFIMRSDTVDKATGKAVKQIATVRVFWHPKGGITSLDTTSLNATYRYVLITPDSVGMYEGAGFIRLSGKDGKPKLKARLMDGDLRLTEASANFVDTLGRSRMRGYFTATYNDAIALDMRLAAQREFFNRSLLSKPAPPPATPVEQPPEMEPTTEPASNIIPPTPITPDAPQPVGR